MLIESLRVCQLRRQCRFDPHQMVDPAFLPNGLVVPLFSCFLRACGWQTQNCKTDKAFDWWGLLRGLGCLLRGRGCLLRGRFIGGLDVRVPAIWTTAPRKPLLTRVFVISLECLFLAGVRRCKLCLAETTSLQENNLLRISHLAK